MIDPVTAPVTAPVTGLDSDQAAFPWRRDEAGKIVPFSPPDNLIGQLQALLKARFEAAFGASEPQRLQALLDAAEVALACIARTDAPYHNREHTLLVCLVGQQILEGKQALGDPVSASDWVHYIISLLFHDIGYVKDALPGDIKGSMAADGLGGWRQLPSGATDAFLTPIHVDRGVALVRQLFAKHPLIDAEVLGANIEHTRFPVSQQLLALGRSRFSWPDLVQAADLIGQLADPAYLQKLPALNAEFVECGVAHGDGQSGHADLVHLFPEFYRKVAKPLMEVGFEVLDGTTASRVWGDSLRATLAQCEAG